MNKVLLALDMDDTLCDTQNEVVSRLREILYDLGYFEQLKDVYNFSHLNKIEKTHSTMLYPGELRTIINEEIIIPGEYIKTVKPTSLITDGGLTATLFHLKNKIDLSVIIATHRPENPQSVKDTKKWLDDNNFSPFVNAMHFINSKIHSNKINYLKSLYPDYRILLLDDNPLGDLNTIHSHNHNVLVYEKLCIYPCYSQQSKFTNVYDLAARLTNMSH